MTYRNKEPVTDDAQLERLKRKRDQEWEMAGLARQDRDEAAAKKHTENARDYSRQIAEYLR